MARASDKAALITGAASGLGLCLSRVAAANGYRLIMADKQAEAVGEAARALAERYGVQARPWAGDLARPEEIDRLIADATSEGPPAVAIGNAGFGWSGDVIRMTPDEQRAMIDLHVIAKTRMITEFGLRMRQAGGGRLMITSSFAGFLPGPNMAVYHATKAYLIALGRAITEEWRRWPVSLTILCPGLMTTPFFARAQMDDGRRLMRHPLLPRMTPDRVAELGWAAMMRGKREYVPGWSNRLMLQALAILPRRIRSRGVHIMHTGRSKPAEAEENFLRPQTTTSLSTIAHRPPLQTTLALHSTRASFGETAPPATTPDQR